MHLPEVRSVGYMYREQPDDRFDSGWRFFSGDESQEYLDEPDHLSIYDVNTIANYDGSIVSLLGSPVMSAYERNALSGRLEPAAFPRGACSKATFTPMSEMIR